jgi:RNA-directed DNA polymerase
MESILSVNKLAFKIGISRQVLEDVAKHKASHYKPFIKSEVKKDGSIKERKIDNPDRAIRQIQKRINKAILQPYCNNLPIYTTGSIKLRSIKDNAAPHVGKQAVLVIDITNCFPSIDSSSVYGVYKDVFRCSPPVARLLTKLTTYGDRIPQGAPTSPGLCNIVLEPLSAKLNTIAAANQLDFTQYVDDLTFSGSRTSLLKVKPIVLLEIQKIGFEINTKKLQMFGDNERMAITGLVVNKTLGVGRKYVREVQRDILNKKVSPAIIKGKIAYVSSVSKSRARKLSYKLPHDKDKPVTQI